MNSEKKVDALGRTAEYYLDLQKKMKEKTGLLLYSCGFYRVDLMTSSTWFNTLGRIDGDDNWERYDTADKLISFYKYFLGSDLVEIEQVPGEIRFWFKLHASAEAVVLDGSAEEVNLEGVNR